MSSQSRQMRDRRQWSTSARSSHERKGSPTRRALHVKSEKESGTAARHTASMSAICDFPGAAVSGEQRRIARRQSRHECAAAGFQFRGERREVERLQQQGLRQVPRGAFSPCARSSATSAPGASAARRSDSKFSASLRCDARRGGPRRPRVGRVGGRWRRGLHGPCR